MVSINKQRIRISLQLRELQPFAPGFDACLENEMGQVISLPGCFKL
jgi:hypothetical protein